MHLKPRPASVHVPLSGQIAARHKAILRSSHSRHFQHRCSFCQIQKKWPKTAHVLRRGEQKTLKVFFVFFSFLCPIKCSAAELIQLKAPSDSYSRFISRPAAGGARKYVPKLQPNFPCYFQLASLASFTVTFAHGCPTSPPVCCL